MWTCSDIRQRSAAYFANELAAQDSQMLEQHLAQCGKCRLELSEAYSGYRLASAAFKAPDSVGGLNTARLGAIYSAVANGPAPAPAAPTYARHRWFAAAAVGVVVMAAWMNQPVPDTSTLLPAGPVAEHVVPDTVVADGRLALVAEPVHHYPASFGLIYPANFRASGGFTPDVPHLTVAIDIDSLTDESIFIYDPAYGMGRTVISDGGHSLAMAKQDYYGLDGPKGRLRLL